MPTQESRQRARVIHRVVDPTQQYVLDKQFAARESEMVPSGVKYLRYRMPEAAGNEQGPCFIVRRMKRDGQVDLRLGPSQSADAARDADGRHRESDERGRNHRGS